MQQLPSKQPSNASSSPFLLYAILPQISRKPSTCSSAANPQITMPPTVNWFNEDRLSTGKWQLMPPIITGRLPAVAPSASLNQTARDAGSSKTVETGALQHQLTGTTSAEMPAIGQKGRRADSLVG